jgi:hypothetical protein
MKDIPITASFLSVLGLAACAGFDFGKERGLTYYDPVPYFFVSTSADCTTTGTVVAMPGEKRSLGFDSGYGATELSANFSNGMISSLGQKTDTKIPETITAIAALAPALRLTKDDSKAAETPRCEPTARLYRVDENGKVDLSGVVDFPVKEKPVKGQTR